MIQRIMHGDQLIALIIPAGFNEPGIHFFTEHGFSQQLAFMHHPAGYRIGTHTHNPVQREVQTTQEVLFIRSGRIRVDLYAPDMTYLESHELASGDVIFLAAGGHGFEILEEIDMIEVKQGPYVGDQDKTRFQGIGNDEVTLVE